MRRWCLLAVVCWLALIPAALAGMGAAAAAHHDLSTVGSRCGQLATITDWSPWAITPVDDWARSCALAAQDTAAGDLAGAYRHTCELPQWGTGLEGICNSGAARQLVASLTDDTLILIRSSSEGRADGMGMVVGWGTPAAGFELAANLPRTPGLVPVSSSLEVRNLWWWWAPTDVWPLQHLGASTLPYLTAQDAAEVWTMLHPDHPVSRVLMVDQSVVTTVADVANLTIEGVPPEVWLNVARFSSEQIEDVGRDARRSDDMRVAARVAVTAARQMGADQWDTLISRVVDDGQLRVFEPAAGSWVQTVGAVTPAAPYLTLQNECACKLDPWIDMAITPTAHGWNVTFTNRVPAEVLDVRYVAGPPLPGSLAAGRITAGSPAGLWDGAVVAHFPGVVGALTGTSGGLRVSSQSPVGGETVAVLTLGEPLPVGQTVTVEISAP